MDVTDQIYPTCYFCKTEIEIVLSDKHTHLYIVVSILSTKEFTGICCY